MKRLPTMSWESVIDDHEASSAPATTADASPSAVPDSLSTTLSRPLDSALASALPSSVAGAPDGVPDSSPSSALDSSPTVRADPPSGSPEDSLVAPLVAPLVASFVSPYSTGPIAIDPITFTALTLDPSPSNGASPPPPPADPPSIGALRIDGEGPPSITFAPLIPIVPALEQASTGPSAAPRLAPFVSDRVAAIPVEPEASPALSPEISSEISSEISPEFSLQLPTIVEATAIPDAGEQTGDATSANFGPNDLATLAAVAAQGPGPRLPRVVAPVQQPASGPYRMPVSEFTAVSSAMATKRSGVRRSLKLVVVLLVLGGAIAAAVVFGRPYLLSGEWDATTEPYANAVETAGGIGFVEPLDVITEATPQFTDRMSRELTGTWSQEQVMWRALGLLRGPDPEATVTEALSGWQDAIYSTVDGQVYRDEAVGGPPSDAQVTEAMAAASLDQAFGWSIGQPSRTIDDAAQTAAEVIRQSREVVAASAFAAELESPEPAVLIFVPPVLGYRALAPTAFAEFANDTEPVATGPTATEPVDTGPAATGPVDTGPAAIEPAAIEPADNALRGIGAGSPGPFVSEVPALASNPIMIGTDVLVGTPRAMDRSFWYLVLAGFLEPRISYDASESIVESAVTMAERDATPCAYVTFSGGDTTQTATLRSALESWSAAASMSLSSTFSVLPDGSLQLVACDPGRGFDTPTRLGAARELVGWRLAELATLEAVADDSGVDFDTAWATVVASEVPVQLAGLAPDTSPEQAAEQARSAVRTLLTPTG